MSQLYTIIAIVGFSLAGVLAVTAIVMFFTLHIKQVRDDLTGKTAARSIAEIRSRAKTRKRVASATVKNLGWEPELSSGALADFALDEEERPTNDLHDDEGATALLASDAPDEPSEAATSLLGGADEAEASTSLLAGAALGSAAPCDEEGESEASTTFLGDFEPAAARGSAR